MVNVSDEQKKTPALLLNQKVPAAHIHRFSYRIASAAVVVVVVGSIFVPTSPSGPDLSVVKELGLWIFYF